MTYFLWVLCALLGYLLGGFSTGLLLSSLSKIDLRSKGSKSTGATNVTRVMGLSAGLATFLGDCAKAVLAMLLGRWIAGEPGGMIGGLFAVIGHNWPLSYRFRGGKGVACSVAVVFMHSPIVGLIAGAVAVLVIVITRFVSLGSLVFLALSTILMFILKGPWPLGIWALLLFLVATYRHRENIKRLIEGKENRFTAKKQDL